MHHVKHGFPELWVLPVEVYTVLVILNLAHAHRDSDSRLAYQAVPSRRYGSTTAGCSRGKSKLVHCDVQHTSLQGDQPTHVPKHDLQLLGGIFSPLSLVLPSCQMYQSRFGLSFELLASVNHSCYKSQLQCLCPGYLRGGRHDLLTWSLLWFTTRSMTSFIPRS